MNVLGAKRGISQKFKTSKMPLEFEQKNLNSEQSIKSFERALQDAWLPAKKAC